MQPVEGDIPRLFHAARALKSAEERAQFLERACGADHELRARLETLLRADLDAGEFLARPPLALHAEQPGMVIDRYKLLQQIGEGGFGSVWMAEQREPVKRRVALKVIKLGMDTKQVVARFEAERQALALMDHASIARVFDAGATDAGRPYFVMELVKGVPIVQHCDTERLDTRARLLLFIAVCHAIQHAHQKGVIHRDIKPSNVLVTLHDGEPVPKVIDFGIAKATQGELTTKTLFTELGQMIGTPAYMSPEQAEMSGLDIDTRTDVYSLGVLLYELLTGTTPFDTRRPTARGFVEVLRAIREDEPERPSTRISMLGATAEITAEQRKVDPKRLGLLLRGDLDWIVMRCLEKNRTHRYESASALAADVQRHLAHEPVLARPPSRADRCAKFVRRNRAAVAAGSAVAVALVLGLGGTTSGWLHARAESKRASASAQAEALASARSLADAERAGREARRAEEEAKRARDAERAERERADELEQVTRFQSMQLERFDARRMGERLRDDLRAETRRGLERDGVDATEMEEALAQFDRLLARANLTDVSRHSIDENLLEPALVVLDEKLGQQPLVQARLLQTIASARHAIGLLEEAVEPKERALALWRLHGGPRHPKTLASANNLALLLQDLGRLDEAESILREVVAGMRETLGVEHADTLASSSNLAALLRKLGKLDEAESLQRENLATCELALGAEHSDTLHALNALGAILIERGSLDEAVPLLRRAAEVSRRTIGPEKRFTLLALGHFAFALSARGGPGEVDEAEALLREVLAVRRRVLGDDHPETFAAAHTLGGVLARAGRADEAIPLLREALEGNQRVLGADHAHTRMSRELLDRVVASSNVSEQLPPR